MLKNVSRAGVRTMVAGTKDDAARIVRRGVREAGQRAERDVLRLGTREAVEQGLRSHSVTKLGQSIEAQPLRSILEQQAKDHQRFVGTWKAQVRYNEPLRQAEFLTEVWGNNRQHFKRLGQSLPTANTAAGLSDLSRILSEHANRQSLLSNQWNKVARFGEEHSRVTFLQRIWDSDQRVFAQIRTLLG